MHQLSLPVLLMHPTAPRWDLHYHYQACLLLFEPFRFLVSLLLELDQVAKKYTNWSWFKMQPRIQASPPLLRCLVSFLTWIRSVVSRLTIASPGVSGISEILSLAPRWPYSLSVPAPRFRLGVSGTFCEQSSNYNTLKPKHVAIIKIQLVNVFTITW